MKIKVGSKIYVESTEAWGIVTKILPQPMDLLIWVKWENFPLEYEYSYEKCHIYWTVLEDSTEKCCSIPNIVRYVGLNSIDYYCKNCNSKKNPLNYCI